MASFEKTLHVFGVLFTVQPVTHYKLQRLVAMKTTNIRPHVQWLMDNDFVQKRKTKVGGTIRECYVVNNGKRGVRKNGQIWTVLKDGYMMWSCKLYDGEHCPEGCPYVKGLTCKTIEECKKDPMFKTLL